VTEESQTPRAHFRAPPGLVERLPQPTNAEATAVARRDLDRYYGILRRELPTLSMNDGLLLVAILGQYPLPSTSGHLLWAVTMTAIANDPTLVTRFDRSAEDIEALDARLRGLSPTETIAIFDAVERAEITVARGMTLPDALLAVGLVRNVE
jgi:hypothetical protein